MNRRLVLWPSYCQDKSCSCRQFSVAAKRRSVSPKRLRGNQADLYVDSDRRSVQKEFRHQSKASVEEQVRFLQDNAESGCVPQLYRVDLDQCLLVMEFLRDFQQLKQRLPDIKAAGTDSVNRLLRSLDSARRQLRTNLHYSDLSNTTNILIRDSASSKHGFEVRFVEGGTATPLQPDQEEAYLQQFLKDVIRDGRLLGSPLAQRIAGDRPWA